MTLPIHYFKITEHIIKEVLYKKEQQQSRFYQNRAHSKCLFASLKWFRKVHVQHAFFKVRRLVVHD